MSQSSINKGYMLGLCAVFFWTSCVLLPQANAADRARTVDGDVFFVDAQFATHLRLFQRSLLPGPAGAIITDDRLMPIYQNVSMRIRDLDSPIGAPNSLQMELAAWGDYTFGDLKGERALDGDVSVANATQRFGATYVRLGRQVYIGGASRFAQYDGLTIGLDAAAGAGRVGIDAYAGMTVLPRWSSRPGYFQLGSAADTLLRYPATVPQPARAGTWQAGARVHGTYPRLGGAGVSIHEQRENGLLNSRKVGFDAHLNPLTEAMLSAQGILDIDGRQLADARIWLDCYPLTHLSAGLEYVRTNPAMFLSKQSVLSVFGVDPFSEVGIDVNYHPVKSFLIGGSGYVERFDTSGLGARVQGRSQITIRRVTLQLALGRVDDSRIGYYSSRASMRWAISDALRFTLDQYYYFYDHRIRGIPGSAVEAAVAEFQVSPAVRLAASTSVAQTPYAFMDTQGMLSMAIDIGDGQPGVMR